MWKIHGLAIENQRTWKRMGKCHGIGGLYNSQLGGCTCPGSWMMGKHVRKVSTDAIAQAGWVECGIPALVISDLLNSTLVRSFG